MYKSKKKGKWKTPIANQQSYILILKGNNRNNLERKKHQGFFFYLIAGKCEDWKKKVSLQVLLPSKKREIIICDGKNKSLDERVEKSQGFRRDFLMGRYK